MTAADRMAVQVAMLEVAIRMARLAKGRGR